MESLKGLLPAPIFLIVVIVVVVALYFIGGIPLTQSADIAGCMAEWSTGPVEVTSEFCPDPAVPCTAQPFAQQHNALVDAFVCACDRASEGGGFPDSEINDQIEDSFAEAAERQLTIREICEGGGGGFLVKWNFE